MSKVKVHRKVFSKKAIVRAAEKVHEANAILRGVIIEFETWLGEDLLKEFEAWRDNPNELKTLAERLVKESKDK